MQNKYSELPRGVVANEQKRVERLEEKNINTNVEVAEVVKCADVA